LEVRGMNEEGEVGCLFLELKLRNSPHFNEVERVMLSLWNKGKKGSVIR